MSPRCTGRKLPPCTARQLPTSPLLRKSPTSLLHGRKPLARAESLPRPPLHGPEACHVPAARRIPFMPRLALHQRPGRGERARPWQSRGLLPRSVARACQGRGRVRGRATHAWLSLSLSLFLSLSLSPSLSPSLPRTRHRIPAAAQAAIQRVCGERRGGKERDGGPKNEWREKSGRDRESARERARERERERDRERICVMPQATRYCKCQSSEVLLVPVFSPPRSAPPPPRPPSPLPLTPPPLPPRNPSLMAAAGSAPDSPALLSESSLSSPRPPPPAPRSRSPHRRRRPAGASAGRCLPSPRRPAALLPNSKAAESIAAALRPPGPPPAAPPDAGRAMRRGRGRVVRATALPRAGSGPVESGRHGTPQRYTLSPKQNTSLL